MGLRSNLDWITQKIATFLFIYPHSNVLSAEAKMLSKITLRSGDGAVVLPAPASTGCIAGSDWHLGSVVVPLVLRLLPSFMHVIPGLLLVRVGADGMAASEAQLQHQIRVLSIMPNYGEEDHSVYMLSLLGQRFDEKCHTFSPPTPAHAVAVS